MGSLSTNSLHGHVFYVTGGGPFYFAIKTARRFLSTQPLVIGGLAMVWGYLGMGEGNAKARQRFRSQFLSSPVKTAD